MKKGLLIAILCCSIVYLGASFQLQTIQETSPLQRLQQYTIEQLDSMIVSLEDCMILLHESNITSTQKSYLAARQHFKQIEFLMAYLDPQLYEKVINESPLLKPEPHVANRSVHQPQGFQMIDEVLFLAPNHQQLQRLLEHLVRKLKSFQLHFQQVKLYDAIVIHAIKEQMIRSLTLGVTGYDTPGSSAAIADLKAVNNGILYTLRFYQDQFPEKYLKPIVGALEKVAYQDFDTFDRYAYLVNCVNPVLENIERLRRALGIESKEELNTQVLPTESSFTNLFQQDFLQGAYYANIPKNEVTRERIALGKRLFKDTKLSSSNTTSCNTCHQKENAFSDGHIRSINGAGTDTISRNSPSLNYSIFATAYFYDLRAKDLNSQFDHVIHDHKEFNSNYLTIIKQLKEDTSYNIAFERNYKHYGQAISTASINHALKCYLISIPSYDSPFDQYVQQKMKNIPVDIRLGFNLFMGKAQCGTCHFPPTFSGLLPPFYKDSESEVLGVLKDENFDNPVLDKDEGRQASGVAKDDYHFFRNSFKTPTVRNAAVSAPYMHNGSIQSLEKLIEFYDLGGGEGMGLDLDHQTLPEDALELSEAEKNALIAFVKSLSDKQYIKEN